MKITMKDILKEVKNYFFITIGLAIFVLGWSAFMTPFEVTGGGVAGIASILYFATKIPIGFTTFALNGLQGNRLKKHRRWKLVTITQTNGTPSGNSLVCIHNISTLEHLR